MRARALSSHKKRTAKEILKVKPWQKRKEKEEKKEMSYQKGKRKHAEEMKKN